MKNLTSFSTTFPFPCDVGADLQTEHLCSKDHHIGTDLQSIKLDRRPVRHALDNRKVIESPPVEYRTVRALDHRTNDETRSPLTGRTVLQLRYDRAAYSVID